MPIPVKLNYELAEDGLVKLVWNIEFYKMDAQNWWNVRVDATHGKIMSMHDQVIHCNFEDHKDDCTGHRHGVYKNEFEYLNKNISTNSALMTGSYNVYPIPLESPNHGDQSLVVNPADGIASPFGWHDTDGQAGAEFTITRGNNAHAYQDVFALNRSCGDEPDGGPDLIFDFPHIESNNQPYTQMQPAIVNLFYWSNVMHDLWYQYGFDETSGNFQANNYGNGGDEGDFVRAEALDGGGTNNATFGTGGDGSLARMQMFIWSNSGLDNILQITVEEPASIAGKYDIALANFGVFLPDNLASRQVVLVDDGIGTTSDACEDIVNGADLTDKIAMIDRGLCQFGTKALKAENEGAIAVIICNNEPGILNMAPGADGGNVTIPTFMLTLDDCNTLKMGLPDLTVNISKPSIPLPGPNGKDGDFDNGIIAHEYAHGISIRLTGGPSNGNCLNNFEQAGEGWSDWFGLVMQTTADNTADQRRGIGTYAINQNINGTGIRDFPYSRDMNINPHTYGDLNSVAVPHGVGSIWAAMIWDMYWNLVDEYGFDDDYYHGYRWQ